MAVVLAGDGDLAYRPDAVDDLLLLDGVLDDEPSLGLARDDLGQAIDTDRDAHEGAEDDHENVEEFTILVGGHASNPFNQFGPACAGRSAIIGGGSGRTLQAAAVGPLRRRRCRRQAAQLPRLRLT